MLLGDVASSVTVISIWKPYFLYRDGFKKPVSDYWKNILLYLCLFALSWLLTDVILSLLPLSKPIEGYAEWVFYALVSSLLYLVILTFFLLLFFKGYPDIAGTFLSICNFLGCTICGWKTVHVDEEGLFSCYYAES